jgi:pyridoxal phosphate enzyme (YggS family)
LIDSAALRARLDGVRERIARAAGRAGRDPATIRLVAVSKTFSADYVRAVAEAGQLQFGENKVQEALGKMRATADLALAWHLVGHLQSNKARKAATHFDTIHSVDDGGLVAKLEEAARAAGRQLELLVQVDLADEPTKRGVQPAQLGAILAATRESSAVRLTGLMLLPPAVTDPEAARPYFVALRRLRDELVANGQEPSTLAQLSMGMSHDFEVAIEEGATMIRVGTAIFGPRGATSD